LSSNTVVDGRLIEAWASHNSFNRKDDDSGTPPGRNPEVDFKGQQRRNDTHASTTDADARLFINKSEGDKSRLCHMGHMRHILMENRNGFIVDVEITHASGAAEGEAARAMLKSRCNRNKRATVRAAKDKHSAVDGRTQWHESYKTRQKVRMRIEEAFGWAKAVGGLAKTQPIGHAKLTGQALLCFATYNLVRMGSLSGWWDAHHTRTAKPDGVSKQRNRRSAKTALTGEMPQRIGYDFGTK
jgi:hypothetical protein